MSDREVKTMWQLVKTNAEHTTAFEKRRFHEQANTSAFV
jgi:hypothetical protein